MKVRDTTGEWKVVAKAVSSEGRGGARVWGDGGAGERREEPKCGLGELVQYSDYGGAPLFSPR